MTTEQLQNGTKLAGEIEHLETQLAGWKAAEHFMYQCINLYVPSQGGWQIETKYVDFEVVKAITIARIEKDLNELKEQFEKL